MWHIEVPYSKPKSVQAIQEQPMTTDAKYDAEELEYCRHGKLAR